MDILRDTDIEERVVAWIEARRKVQLNQKTSIRRGRIQGIPKLEDALWAGGPRAHETTLIITEGDSAKALAVSGLSVLGREKFGVYPLRGKMLNVRDAAHSRILQNEEVNQLQTILGLSHDEDYASGDPWEKGLRYGKVMLMTDQVCASRIVVEEVT